MSLLDQFLPKFSFSEKHSLTVHAQPSNVIQCSRRYRPEADQFFKTMIGLREVPLRLLSAFGYSQRADHHPFSLDNFTLLAEEEGQELLYGLVGRFWQYDYGLIPIEDDAAFLDYKAVGVAKLILSIRATKHEAAECNLVTETRVFCPDAYSIRRFAPYWYLIRPVSGLIRRRMLKSIKSEAEKNISSRRFVS